MDYVSVKEAAQRLGVGEASIRGYLRAGLLAGRKRGVWKWEVEVSSLEAFEKRQISEARGEYRTSNDNQDRN